MRNDAQPLHRITQLHGNGRALDASVPKTCPALGVSDQGTLIKLAVQDEVVMISPSPPLKLEVQLHSHSAEPESASRSKLVTIPPSPPTVLLAARQETRRLGLPGKIAISPLGEPGKWVFPSFILCMPYTRGIPVTSCRVASADPIEEIEDDADIQESRFGKLELE